MNANERCIGTLCSFYKFTKHEDSAEQPWMKATCRAADVVLFHLRDTGQFVEALLLDQPCVIPPELKARET